MLIRNIQVFIGFANFYQRFIQSFSKIAIVFISLLKTTRSFKELAPKAFKVDNNEFVDGDSNNKTNEIVVNVSKNNKSKSLMRLPNIGALGKPIFLTSNTKKAFNHLR